MESGIFLLLGSNEGNRGENLAAARSNIAGTAGRIAAFSSIYKTAAWGNVDQSDFYNQVLKIETSLTPQLLLQQVLAIENAMGRKRSEKWGPRVIDIDLLFYHALVIREAELVIPHPGIAHRRFTLAPLCEIAPALIHPVLKKNISTLLRECSDDLPVEVTGLSGSELSSTL